MNHKRKVRRIRSHEPSRAGRLYGCVRKCPELSSEIARGVSPLRIGGLGKDVPSLLSYKKLLEKTMYENLLIPLPIRLLEDHYIF